MEGLLQDPPAAESMEELYVCLKPFLTQFQEASLQVKRGKCQCAMCHGAGRIPKLPFGSQRTSPNTHEAGDNPLSSTPKDKMDLQAFLGLQDFYNAFFPQKASVADSLHHLLDKKALWS